jgi:hypothetical protein
MKYLPRMLLPWFQVCTSFGIISKGRVSTSVKVATKNLALNKGHHFILAYDWTISSRLRFNAETYYYQSLFDMPVGFNDGGTFSAINLTGFN